jgi:hypothetical protein
VLVLDGVLDLAPSTLGVNEMTFGLTESAVSLPIKIGQFHNCN